jgi:hypothetical protein
LLRLRDQGAELARASARVRRRRAPDRRGEHGGGRRGSPTGSGDAAGLARGECGGTHRRPDVARRPFLGQLGERAPNGVDARELGGADQAAAHVRHRLGRCLARLQR